MATKHKIMTVVGRESHLDIKSFLCNDRVRITIELIAYKNAEKKGFNLVIHTKTL